MVEEIVLIDDDPIIGLLWKSESKKRAIRFTHFFSFQDFITEKIHIPLNAHIFIDYNLKNTNGNIVAEEIFKLGFKNLYIATGEQSKSKKYSKRIIKKTGKDFPEFIFNLTYKNQINLKELIG